MFICVFAVVKRAAEFGGTNPVPTDASVAPGKQPKAEYNLKLSNLKFVLQD